MNKLKLIAGLAACLTPSVFATSTFFAESSTTLYTITVNTGLTTATAAADPSNFGSTATMTDIAMVGNVLYGVDSTSKLYTINTATGVASLSLGSTGHVFGELASNFGTLYAVGNGTDLYSLATSNGAATQVTSGTLTGTGDLEFFNGFLYTISGVNSNLLETVNLSTGALTPVGTVGTGAIGFNNVVGLAATNGVLFGVTSAGQVISIATGGAGNLGTAIGASTAIAFTGASATPEPATFGIIGLGLLGLGGLAYRRRKA